MQGKAISQKQWQKFFEKLILNEGNVKKTCDETGINRTTYYINREKEKGLMEEAKKSLQAIYVPMAETVIILALARGDATTARWVLQCLTTIWNPQEIRKFTGEIGVKVKQEIPETSSVWDEIEKEYAKKWDKIEKRGISQTKRLRLDKRGKNKK